MKLTNSEMTGIALFILYIVYLYYTPISTTIYETQPVYYPVYKTQYVPINRPRPRRYPVRPRPHPLPHPHKQIPSTPTSGTLPTYKFDPLN